MPGFKAALINELYKIFKRKKLITAAVLSVLAVLIGQAAVTAVQAGFGVRMAGSAEFPLIVLPFFVYTILPMFATFVAIDLFNGEYSAGTMKITLTRPVSRFSVFTAKVTSVALFILGSLMFVMLVSMLAGFIFNPVSAAFMGLVRAAAAYLVSFLPVFVFALLVILLSNLVRSGVTVFFLSLFIFLGFIMMEFIFSKYASFFVTSQFTWYTLWISQSLNILKLLRQTLLMAGLGIMLFTAGYYLFDRRDL